MRRTEKGRDSFISIVGLLRKSVWRIEDLVEGAIGVFVSSGDCQCLWLGASSNCESMCSCQGWVGEQIDELQTTEHNRRGVMEY